MSLSEGHLPQIPRRQQRDDGAQEDAPHFTELLGLILISDISNI